MVVCTEGMSGLQLPGKRQANRYTPPLWPAGNKSCARRKRTNC